jgi:hypothetical protein
MDVDQAVAVIEVQNTMSKYEFFLDSGDLEGLRGVYHEDISMDFGVFGSLEGKEAAIKFARDYDAGNTVFNDSWHMIGTPWIEAEGNSDGDTAVGRWYQTGAFDLDGVGACWVMGPYENEFVKTSGGWRLKTTDWDEKYIASAEDGWDRRPIDLSFKQYEGYYE